MFYDFFYGVIYFIELELKGFVEGLYIVDFEVIIVEQGGYEYSVIFGYFRKNFLLEEIKVIIN